VAGVILADTCSHPIPRDREMADTIPSSADGVEALSAWWAKDRPVPAPADRAAFEHRRARFLENSADGLGHAITACADRIPVTGRLGEITAPTLVIAGEHDLFFSPEMHADLARRIPGARLEVIPGAGHISCHDRPEVFAGLVAGFL